MRARHVYPDGMIRMICVLRVTMRCVARVLRRRGPYTKEHISNYIKEIIVITDFIIICHLDHPREYTVSIL